tara:strand:- start:688 stop:1179 length:492 start_codon:yes stop_codon:yes gene_type:complete
LRRLGIILFFVGCQSNNLNYRVANELFENFDTILSPEEYAKTIYFYKDNMGEWRDLKDSLVNINIPYKGDYFTFSKSFLNENPENSDGTLSDYISKYENGIQSISYYKLDKIIYKKIEYSEPLYIILMDSERNVYKAELYSISGDLIKEAKTNFLKQIRRAPD